MVARGGAERSDAEPLEASVFSQGFRSPRGSLHPWLPSRAPPGLWLVALRPYSQTPEVTKALYHSNTKVPNFWNS